MQKRNAASCLLAIMVLLFSSILYAEQATQQPAQQSTEQESGNEAGHDQAEHNNEEPNESELPDIDGQPIQPGSGGPGRFIPSEQISQDLGVSFPVDI